MIRAAIRRGRVLTGLVALLLTLGVLGGGTASASAPTRVGGDVSWPQCPVGTGIPTRQGEGKPMPTRAASFVVLGLTNGPGFVPNPCLGRQVRWSRRHHVWTSAYAMTTYPRRRQLARTGGSGPFATHRRLGRLRNSGYQQALFNVRTMARVGAKSPIVWVDVEPYPVAPWTRSVRRNRAVVQGVVAGYESAGLRVGFYSTPSMWRSLVGGLRYGYPEWHTAGGTTMAAARAKCGHDSLQGGRTVLAQWWDDRRDHDVSCPGYARTLRMRRFFTRH